MINYAQDCILKRHMYLNIQTEKVTLSYLKFLIQSQDYIGFHLAFRKTINRESLDDTKDKKETQKV